VSLSRQVISAVLTPSPPSYHLPIDRLRCHALVCRRPCLCWPRCWSRVMFDPYVPIRMVITSSFILYMPTIYVFSSTVRQSGSVAPVSSSYFPATPSISSHLALSSRLVLPMGHHNRSLARFSCQQRNPEPTRPLLLPYPHLHSVHLGCHPVWRHVLPSRVTSLSHQEGAS
jgi:hypothetical protein